MRRQEHDAWARRMTKTFRWKRRARARRSRPTKQGPRKVVGPAA